MAGILSRICLNTPNMDNTTITLKFTPLPNGMILNNSKTLLQVSLVVTIGVTPETIEKKGTLKDYPVFQDWPKTMGMLLANAGTLVNLNIPGLALPGIHPNAVGFDQAVASRAWNYLFPETMPVSHKDRTNLYADSKAPLGQRQLLPEKSTGDTYTEYLGHYYTQRAAGAAALDDRYKNRFLGLQPTKDNPGIIQHLGHQNHSFNRAAKRRRGGSEDYWKSKLNDRRALDFNHCIANLGHYPDLLRKLGLIVDLTVDIGTALATAGKPVTALNGQSGLMALVVDKTILPPANPALDPALPQVKVFFDTTVAAGHYGANSFFAASFNTLTDLVSQRMLLVRPDGSPADDSTDYIQVSELDAVGAAYKANSIAQQINNGTDLMPYSGNKTAGLALNQETLHANNNQRLLTGTAAASTDKAPTIYAEDLIKGYRIDVRSSADLTKYPIEQQAWYSLCQQELHIDARGYLPGVIKNEGWVSVGQAYAQSPTDAADAAPYLVVAGTLTRWEGWSVCVPRPGNGQLNNGTTSAGSSNGQYNNFDRLKVSKKVQARTLPKLRYGWTYQFRIRTVDIAGNGLPLDAAITDPLTADKYITRSIVFTRPEPFGAPVLVPGAKLYEGGGHQQSADQAQKNGNVTAVTITKSQSAGGNEINTITVQKPVPGVKISLSAAGVDSAPTLSYQVTKADTAAMVATQLAAKLSANGVWTGKANIVSTPGSAGFTVTAIAANTSLLLSAGEKAPPAANPVNKAGHEGETVENIVVRSDCREGVDPTVLPQRCERHLLPPQITADMAEKLGNFDGPDTAGFYKMVVDYDGLAPDFAGPDASLDVPYLGDSETRAFQITLDKLPADPANIFFWYKKPYGWPKAKPWKLVVVPVKAGERFQLIRPSGDEGKIEIHLPQSETHTVTISSACVHESVKAKSWLFKRLFPRVAALATAAANIGTEVDKGKLPKGEEANNLVAHSVVGTAVSDALGDDLFPTKTITLVHAVQKALAEPVISGLVFGAASIRPLNSTAAILQLTPADYQAISSVKMQVYATWKDYEDTAGQFGATGAFDKRVWEFDFLPADTAATINGTFSHQLGDTKRRQVTYRIENISRFAAYFAKGTDLFRSSRTPYDESKRITVDIPSSAPPHSPIVVRTVPLYRHEHGKPDLTSASKTLRGNGLRIYLQKGSWFSSGVGEVLGVVVMDKADVLQNFLPDDGFGNGNAQTIITLDKHFVSLIGRDVARNTTAIQLLDHSQFAGNITEVTSPENNFIGYYRWNPTAGADSLDKTFVIKEVKKAGDPPDPAAPADPGLPCRIVRYDVQPTHDGQFLYADILLDGIKTYFPFLRLALVRLQPNSIDGCYVSPLVQLDYCQLPSDRTVTVHHQLRRIEWVEIDTNGQCKPDNLFYVAMEEIDPISRTIIKRDFSGCSTTGGRSRHGVLFACTPDGGHPGMWRYQRVEGKPGLPYQHRDGHEIVIYEFENYGCATDTPPADPLNEERLRLVSMETVELI